MYIFGSEQTELNEVNLLLNEKADRSIGFKVYYVVFIK